MGLSALPGQLASAGHLAAGSPGRLPGLLVFAVGMLVGGLTVVLVSLLPAGRQVRTMPWLPAPGWLPAPARAPGAAVAADAGRLPPVPQPAARAALAPPPRTRLAGQPAREAAQPQQAQPQQAQPQQAQPQQAQPQHPSLRIGVLGSLTVNGQAGALVPAQSQLIVALALHPGGLPNPRLRALLGADPEHPKPADSLRQLIARTRRALGRTADGREWIEHLGHGRYALHPAARVDWREFQDLTAGLALARAGPLTEALNLIRGQPFTGCYYWWLETAMVESVTAAIVAAADRLAGLSLAGRDPAGAVRAARIGLAADPSAERLWRNLMTAEHAAGNLAGVREAWGRCREAVAEVAADGQPESATSAVYDRLLAR